MSCFTDYITVNGTCSDATSQSDYSLKDIGITVSELNDIVTKDFKNGKDLGEQKIAFAIKQVTNSVYNHFAGKFRSRSILDGQRIGYPQPNMQSVAAIADHSKGVEIEMCNNNSFVDIYISEISLFVNFSGNVDVKIYDLHQNKLLDTITVAAVAGEISRAFVNKSYSSERRDLNLAIIYDSTGKASFKTEMKLGGCSDCSTGAPTWISPYFKARGVKIANADTKIKSNLRGVADTGGLSIQYNVNCNYNAWLCSVRNLIALPVLYKAGEQLMEFALHNSDRLNSKTIIDMEKVEGRWKLYGEKHREALDNILKNIRLPEDSRCFDCREKSKTVTMLP